MKGQNNNNIEKNNSIKVIFTKCNGVNINNNNNNKNRNINNIITYNNNNISKYYSFNTSKNQKKKIYLDNGQNTDISSINNNNISHTINNLCSNKDTNNNQIKSRNFSVIRLKYKNNNNNNNNLLFKSLKNSHTNFKNYYNNKYFNSLNEFNDLSNSNIKQNVINIQLDNKISFIEKEDLKNRKNKIYFLKKLINNIDLSCFNNVKKKIYKKKLLIKFLINNDIFNKKYFEEKKLNNLLNYIQNNKNFENIFNSNYKENLIKILLKKSLSNNNKNNIFKFNNNYSNTKENENENFFKKRSKSNYLNNKNNKIVIPKPLNNNTLFTNLEIKEKIQKNYQKFILNKNNLNNFKKNILSKKNNLDKIKNIIKINKFLKLNNNNINY